MNPSRLRELFDFDPESGTLRWRARPASDFKSLRACATWNARFAGKEAGSVDHYGYREVSVDNKALKAHRIAWAWVTGEWPSGDIDHKDGCKTNNRFVNLRDLPRVVNTENTRRARSDNRTGLLGVHLHKASGLYHACIKVRGKKHSLGYHRDAEAAHAAYMTAKRRLHEGCTV